MMFLAAGPAWRAGGRSRLRRRSVQLAALLLWAAGGPSPDRASAASRRGRPGAGSIVGCPILRPAASHSALPDSDDNLVSVGSGTRPTSQTDSTLARRAGRTNGACAQCPLGGWRLRLAR